MYRVFALVQIICWLGPGILISMHQIFVFNISVRSSVIINPLTNSGDLLQGALLSLLVFTRAILSPFSRKSEDNPPLFLFVINSFEALTHSMVWDIGC